MNTLRTITATLLMTFVTFSANAGTTCDTTKKSCCFRLGGGDFHYWEGLDVGVSGWLTPSRSTALPEAWNMLSIDYARSRHIAWNVFQHNFHLYKNHVNLVSGLGLEWNMYAFQNNITLNPEGSQLGYSIDSIDYRKNRLRTTWITAPLMLEFNTGKDEEKSFHIGAGVKGAYNPFRNQLKQVYEVNGEKVKDKRKDDYFVEPFRYSLTARVGYGRYTVFADYALSEMFRKDKGPKVNSFSAGINIHL